MLAGTFYILVTQGINALLLIGSIILVRRFKCWATVVLLIGVTGVTVYSLINSVILGPFMPWSQRMPTEQITFWKMAMAPIGAVGGILQAVGFLAFVLKFAKGQ